MRDHSYLVSLVSGRKSISVKPIAEWGDLSKLVFVSKEKKEAGKTAAFWHIFLKIPQGLKGYKWYKTSIPAGFVPRLLPLAKV